MSDHGTPFDGDYDLYDKGVLVGRATLRGAHISASSRDLLAAGAWSDHGELNPAAPMHEQPLPGGLRALPALFAALLAADWRAGQPLPIAAAVEDVPERRFVPHGDRTLGADTFTCWTQDGGMLRDSWPPLDLLFTACGDLVAALDPGLDTVMVRPGYEALTSLSRWLADDISPAAHTARVAREMVLMSDCVRLATDVYLPHGVTGPVPAILCRTPYGIGNVLPSPAHQVWMYVARGYAVVMQDVRGRGDSEGVREYIKHEPRDGDETLTWLAGQPWCDGNVGTMGASYPGHTQWLAAMSGNPGLKAMVPVVSMGTPHNDMPYIGGALNAGVCAWAYFMEGGERQRDDWAELLRERPIAAFVARGLGKPSLMWDILMNHTLYDDYWRAIDWTLHGEQIDVPTLNISGWYDDDLPGTLANWALMQQHGRAHQRLILGGWRHYGNVDRAIHGVEFGPAVIRGDLYVEMFRWHERWLKGVANGAEQAPAVQYFSVGDNVWKTADAWPPRAATSEAWHLRAHGGLTRGAPGAEPPDCYRYDPSDPAPSSILRHLHLNEQNLPDDYQTIEARPDVLTYTSEMLTEPLELAGNLSMVLYAASSARDTDWIARLCDVYPDGRSMRLVEGVIRARHRNTFERAELLTPGQIERYEIKLRAHANVFLPGHRLRLSVTSSAEGYIFPNSNTGEDETIVTRTVVADQTIYHDADRPSHVLLPIVRHVAPS